MALVHSNTLAERARETAHDLASRLAAANTADFSRGLGGHAGYAIAWLALHQDDPRETYANHWHAAMRSAASHSIKDASLGYGIAGLRAACALSLVTEPRYFDLLQKCDASLSETLKQELLPKHFGDIDLISGPAGSLAALSLAPTTHPDFMVHHLAAMCSNDAALALLHPLQKGTPVHDMGTAHGIFGLCSTLAMHAEILDDSERAAVTHTLRDATREVEYVHGVAVLRPWREAKDMAPSQNAWCYGIPGAASATLCAAEALGDDTLRDWTLDAFRTLAPCDPDQVSENAGLCHGSAGIAMCLMRAAQLDRRLQPMLLAYIEATIQRARLGQFDTEFGGEDVYNGPPGVVLTLLTFAGSWTPQWLRLFAAAVPE